MSETTPSPSVQKVLLVGHVTGMVGAVSAAVFAMSHKATYGRPLLAAVVALIVYGLSLSLRDADYPAPLLGAACVATFPAMVIPLMLVFTGSGALFSSREMTPVVCILPGSALLISATVMEFMLRGAVGKGLLTLIACFFASACVWISVFNIFYYR
jgi:hypothetical protein